MIRRFASASNQSGGTATSVALILGAAALLFLVTLHTVATIKHSRVVDSWEPTIGTLEAFVERYPATETSVEAFEIERIAASLGVDIAPRRAEDRARPTIDAKNAFVPVKKQVFGRWLKASLEQEAASQLDAPPAPFREYLAANEENLRELRFALSSGQPPAWPSDVSRLYAAPIPNLLGSIDLVKLMSSAALERVEAGDPAAALEYAEATWRLAEGLRNSPILINQLIAIAETRMLAGVLRHIRDVPDVWLDRLSDDYRGDFLEALKYEGWAWLHYDSSDLTGESVWQTIAKPVVQPYATYCMADVSADWRERIVNLEQVESICDYDLSAWDADLDIPVPRWNYFGELFIPNISNAVYRLSRLEMDLELTRLTIETHRALAAGFTPDGILPSHACASDSWHTSVEDGELRIAFSRPIDWENQAGPVLPTRTLRRLEEAPAR